MVIKNHDNFIHHSITMTLAESSKKENEREKISGLKGKRQLYKPKNIHGDLVRSADTWKNFSKGATTNWICMFYTIKGIRHDRT